MRRKAFLLLFYIITATIFPISNDRSKIVAEIYRSVEKWYGTVYKYGGKEKNGVDCSGLTVQVYKEVFGINLPRSVTEQKKLGKAVINTLEPGDLLFFNINGSISHVGIYLFKNKFVHAASSGDKIGVVKSSLDESYYKQRFVFAKRLVTLPAFKK